MGIGGGTTLETAGSGEGRGAPRHPVESWRVTQERQKELCRKAKN